MKPIPKLQKENGLATLHVDGKPYLALSGEVHNSSASSTAYMREKVWPNLRGMHMNTVIAPVYWEQVEPCEGQFDFTVLKELIQDARAEGLRLILLWFGLWKNGASTYVPGWVKRNPDKYFLCVNEEGRRVNTVSPLCREAVLADAKAFQKLMQFIKEMDEKERTVLMVQVENEIGLLGSARDHSPKADEQFGQEVPSLLSEKGGTWSESFGKDAEEYFMGWHYANAVETIAKAGKAVYPLPMYVNAWLIGEGDTPGVYPSGGPVSKIMHIWQKGAPSIDLLAPDIYLPDFEAVLQDYTKNGNPLLIPETGTNVSSAASVFLAVGQYHALGFSPFGIEDIMGKAEEDLKPDLEALNIMEVAFDKTGAKTYLPESYKLLGNLWDFLVPYRGTKKLQGFYQYKEASVTLSFTAYDIKITFNPLSHGKPCGGGLIIEVSPETFYVAGVNFHFTFLPKAEGQTADAALLEEGSFEKGVWHPKRILNGDERHLKIGEHPQALYVEAYTY